MMRRVLSKVVNRISTVTVLCRDAIGRQCISRFINAVRSVVDELNETLLPNYSLALVERQIIRSGRSVKLVYELVHFNDAENSFTALARVDVDSYTDIHITSSCWDIYIIRARTWYTMLSGRSITLLREFLP